MAMTAPAKIISVVIVAIFIKTTKEAFETTFSTKNIKRWPVSIYNNYLRAYNGDGNTIQLLWDEYIEFCKGFIGYFRSGYWTDELASIHCPVMIFHGDLVRTRFTSSLI